MQQSGKCISSFLVAFVFNFNMAYSQNNFDKLSKKSEFTYEFYRWVENYTNKVEEVSDWAEIFHQLLGDVVSRRPSDIMASDVAKPVGQVLRDFKKEAQDIKIPEYEPFVVSNIVLGDNAYENRKMISIEVSNVVLLNQYFKNIGNIKNALNDLDGRYNQMRNGIYDVQVMFRNHGRLLVGLEYDWIAFETTYPNILGEAHTIIKEKNKEYSVLENKLKYDLKIAVTFILEKLSEEKEKNSLRQKELEQLKKLNEELQVSRKILNEFKKEFKKYDSLTARSTIQIENERAILNKNIKELSLIKGDKDKISAPGYLESTYNLCPKGNNWKLCTSGDHIQYKNKHVTLTENQLQTLQWSIERYNKRINKKEIAILKYENEKKEFSQQAIQFRVKYIQNEPSFIKKEKELTEKTKQFYSNIYNNIIESVFQNIESDNLQINRILSSIN